jgi:hypothetical protein
MLRSTLLAAALAALAGAAGAVSPDEARQLGTTLTPVGAERAGNKEGTIPAYTGGIAAPPASDTRGSALRADPFAGEKPRLVTRSGSPRARASCSSATPPCASTCIPRTARSPSRSASSTTP